MRKPIREKQHRLPLECYRGEIFVSLTANVAYQASLFENQTVVAAFVECLQISVKRHDCVVPIYCFMPDHLHLITAIPGEPERKG